MAAVPAYAGTPPVGGSHRRGFNRHHYQSRRQGDQGRL